jgi:uncharacterized membrane protein YphA (DoxX/SURF4 family)
VVWSFVDRKRSNYELMYAWFRVYIRFALGTVLVRYGSMKLFPSQFPSPAFFTLSEPFGQASPMGLLWTFMGASRPYSIFAGAAEFVSGALLFVPWTEALGALLGAAVMSRVTVHASLARFHFSGEGVNRDVEGEVWNQTHSRDPPKHDRQNVYPGLFGVAPTP